jgi:hypothetical protein
MSIQMSHVLFLAGSTPTAKAFAKSCVAGDTQSWPINFKIELPGNVRIIVTANDRNVGDGLHNAAAVGIAQKVSAGGFLLTARNSDCAGGAASFDWIAFSDVPLKGPQREIPFVRARELQGQHFKPSCTPGDTQLQKVTFWSPLPDPDEFVFLTARAPWPAPSNLNPGTHNSAGVGIVQVPDAVGFNLSARSSDCAEGDCAFDCFAITTLVKQPGGDAGNLQVDAGEVNAIHFSASCAPGDTQTMPVDFHQPFLTPPIVLLTANDLGLSQGSHNAAAVGVAADVTPYGFTLLARNSDCAAGEAGFYWVAIGCNLGCG